MELRDSAPEGLIPWIKEQKDIDWVDYLLFKHGRVRDPITGISSPCTDAVCTACGAKQKLAKAYGVHPINGNANFGVGWYSGGRYYAYGSGGHCRCPECGAPVTARYCSSCGGDCSAR